MNPSQIVDLIVLAVLLFCTIRGATRGTAPPRPVTQIVRVVSDP